MSLTRNSVGCCMLALLLSQTACSTVVSQNPLSDPATAKVDERLIGQWKGVAKDKDGETTYFFVGRPRPDDLQNAPAGLMVSYDISFTAKHEVSSGGPYYFFVTKMGAEHYANLLEAKAWKK